MFYTVFLYQQNNLASGETLQQSTRQTFASKIEFCFSTHPLPNCGWIVILNPSQQNVGDTQEQRVVLIKILNWTLAELLASEHSVPAKTWQRQLI